MPIHAHHGAEGLKPEWMGQPAQQHVTAVVMDDSFAHHRAKAGHALGQPFRHPAAMKRQVGQTKDELTIAEALLSLIPMLGLVLLVMGGIYSGWFTPTESGAVGALGALLLAIARRRLTLTATWRVLIETGYVTVSILFLIIAANIYSRLLALSGMPQALDAWVTASQFSFYTLLIVYVLIIVAMGTLIDGVSIMLIMVPMFLAPLQSYDVNLIWFGIISVIAVEIGLLTPPFGLSVFVIKSTLDDDRITLNDIFAGAAPYAVVMFLVLLLIIFVPGVVLVLL
jgi:tripartite ATP-independent transporter DctM subunit